MHLPAFLCDGESYFCIVKFGENLGSKQAPDPKYFPKFYYAKRRFSITSKCRHMDEVLNVDEIKN
jgi:hypothetical protein